MLITGQNNPRVKKLIKLRDKKLRLELGVILVEGLREMRLALDSGLMLLEAYFPGSGPEAGKALEMVRDKAPSALTFHLEGRAFEKACVRGQAADVIGVFSTPEPSCLGDLSLGSSDLVIALEGVEKPGNLGAVLRTADAVGARAVLVLSPQVDTWSPNVIRSSMGARFTVPVLESGFSELAAWAEVSAVPVVLAMTGSPYDCYQTSMKGSRIIVMGSESDGLGERWSCSDYSKVWIPMRGSVDSLNLSVSTAILAYEWYRQQGFQPG